METKPPRNPTTPTPTDPTPDHGAATDPSTPHRLTFWDATPNPRDAGPTSDYRGSDDKPLLREDEAGPGPGLSLTFSHADPAPEPPAKASPRDAHQLTPRDRHPDAGLYDAHTHTHLCKHARGTIEQYAAVAKQRGLAGIIVTCHNPMPDDFAAAMRMDPPQLDHYVALVEQARRSCEGQVDVRLGLEADYVPGYESAVADQLAAHDFDFVLGSIHPQIPEYQKRFFDKDTFKYQQLYFQHLADSAETGLFDSLSHPDIIKMLMPRGWSVSKIMDDVCRSLDRIAATQVAMEFNTSGWRRPMNEACPGSRMLYEMAVRRIPITLGSDAHSPQRVGEGFRKALRLIQAAGYRKVSVFQKRQRHDLDIAAVYRSLTPDITENPATSDINDESAVGV